MMDLLWSTPPHTLRMFSPACWATSTNWTGDGAGFVVAVCRSAGSLQFQSGVARASVSAPPSTKREEPRKRLRGKIMGFHDYRDWSSASQRAGSEPLGSAVLLVHRLIGWALSETGAGRFLHPL